MRKNVHRMQAYHKIKNYSWDWNYRLRIAVDTVGWLGYWLSNLLPTEEENQIVFQVVIY